MKSAYKKILFSSVITVVIAAILFGAWYLTEAELKNSKAKSKKTIFSTPSMTIKGFVLEQTNGDKIDWTLNSKGANMFGAPSNQMIFSEVNALVYGTKDQKEVYTINAATGSYLTKEDKINLKDDVVVKTTSGYTFYTQEALYDIAKKKISTKASVNAQGSSSSGEAVNIAGNGLKGDIAVGDFYLIEDVVATMGKKLNIKSNKAVFNTKQKNILFDGDVSAQKEKITIGGDKMSVGYDKKGVMNDMDVQGKVVIKTGDKKALCENALIKVSSDEIVLTGKPEFHAGKDIIVGDKIVFFTNSEEVYVSKVRAAVSEKAVRKK
jgi:LPS export ABC transporter protein LptC/lipopolysaccharide transport protein LptA